jgi:branched-chain amino acid transport system substrate-binding protein
MKRLVQAGLVGFAASAMLTVTPAVADNIRIGFNVPLTGFAAADGNSALKGAELAVEQVNAAGGIGGKSLEPAPRKRHRWQ